MRALVGLGNPGEKYANTRHNAGFWMLDRLATELNVSWQVWRKCLIARVLIEEEIHLLVKPQNFMNLSGQAVREVLDFYKLYPEELAIVADDVYLLPGTIRIRQGGSDGGHNGWKSVEKAIGENSYWRIRIGVGMYDVNAPYTPPLEDYVLREMEVGERKLVTKVIDQATLDLIHWLRSGEIEHRTISLLQQQ